MLTGERLRQKLKPSAGKFHALGNLSRLSILYTLAREPMEFGRIVHRMKLSPSLTAHHLNELVNAGWVTRIKVGKFVTYYMADDVVKEMSTLLRKLLSLQSESN